MRLYWPSHRRRHRIAANRATDPVITGRKQVRLLRERVYKLSTTFSTLACQDRQRPDYKRRAAMACGTVTQGGGHARGVKKDKQRSDRRRNAVHL
jgi:hypothetical protein